jgi:hypothetical protein
MIPKLYKYLKREHAELMMTEGAVRIGTLVSYQVTEDESRKDPNEGKKVSVTAFPHGAKITNAEEWQRELGFLERSNIHYVRGTVRVAGGAQFLGKDDVPHGYIYCTSKVYSTRLMAKFGTDSCVEILDAQRFLSVIDQALSDLGLIYSGKTYAGISSGRDVEYSGHTVDSKLEISGDWLKDARFSDEAEFRFRFVPIMRHAGKVIQPVCRRRNGVTGFSFPRLQDVEVKVEPLVIRCKELMECCRWKR